MAGWADHEFGDAAGSMMGEAPGPPANGNAQASAAQASRRGPNRHPEGVDLTDAVSLSIPAGLTTALVADACVRLGVSIRHAPRSIRPLVAGVPLVGAARPARHAGSVDVFLEAIELSRPGDILVIDDGGRTDRACIGDLTALEFQAAGLAGVVVWGSHRDGAELRAIGLPVYSCGTHPAGPSGIEPRRHDALLSAQIDQVEVTSADLVIADEDGVMFVAISELAEIGRVAGEIATIERAQAAAVRSGRSLREQLRFAEYLERRRHDPLFEFRQHLRKIGGAIEE